MTLVELAKTERALPAIWTDSGYNDNRPRFYLDLVNRSGLVKGGADVICEFVAAMLLESGLDNLAIGNNAQNGSDNPQLGIGWCQLDTGYHVANLDALHLFRSTPEAPFFYVVGNDDLCYHGAFRTHFNKQRWHAWEKKRIDPKTGWNPLEAMHTAWVDAGLS